MLSGLEETDGLYSDSAGDLFLASIAASFATFKAALARATASEAAAAITASSLVIRDSVAKVALKLAWLLA